MNNWLIVTDEQLIALNAINDLHDSAKCNAIQTVDGTWVTSADKINNEYWTDWQELLQSLTPFEGEPSFPVQSDV